MAVMPSWAGLSASQSSIPHQHDLSHTSTSTTCSYTRDQAVTAHVRKGSKSSSSNGNNHSNGKDVMNGHKHVNTSYGSYKNIITMPWSSVSTVSHKGKGKGKASHPLFPVTGAAASGSEGYYHDSDSIPHSTRASQQDEEEEDEQAEEDFDSISPMTSEEAEALLWDAQMALIAHQYQTGVSLLEKAAKGGSSTACLSLANIYHKGLPCSTHHAQSHHKKHTISPSKLIEGSISTDQVKTASYLLQALELEAAKADYDEFDLEVLSDAALLLCNMFRYGKIRPRDPARTAAGPMRELSVSPGLKKSNSFLNPILDESLATSSASAWQRGGRLAKVLTEEIKDGLAKQGVSWSVDSDGEGISTATSYDRGTTTLQDSDLEKLDSILVSLYYILALVSGSREGPEAIEESVRHWKLLLASHAVFQNFYLSKHKPKSTKNGHAPIRRNSRPSPRLDDLVAKAEKRLQLLTTALEESQREPNGSNANPRDIILRRDTSEYSSSLLFSPTSETSMNFGSSLNESSKQEGPTSNTHASQQSIDTACSCESPIPPSPKHRDRSPQIDKTPQRKRAAKFAIHDSPVSAVSAAPLARATHLGAPTSRQRTVPPSLFRGFQNQSRSNLRQSLTAQSTSSSHLSLADLASSASSIAPSTYMRPGDLRRPLLDRKASQVSLASTTAFGRRAWAGPSGKPLSRVSNLSSASLHTLAPTTDRYMSESGVLSLPHDSPKARPVNAAQVLSSLRASTSAATPGPSNYTGRLRNVVSSLGSFFAPSSSQDAAAEASKAKKELEKVAEQHDAEVENFYSWEEDRTSSEEESLHSGSPSNAGDADSAQDDIAEAPHQAENTAPLSSSRGRQVRNADSTPQRPVYPLSTSISSSYLHASTPRSSPRRGGMPTFTPPLSARTSSTDAKPSRGTEASSLRPPSERPSSNHISSKTSPNKPAKIDPLLAALEAASRVNVKSRCAVCGIQGVNFPACHRCGMTFCSRDCRIASGGEEGKHVFIFLQCIA